MSQCIEKIPHEECGSSDGLQVFEEGGSYNGYCFACSTFIANPYHDKPADYKPVRIKKTPEQIAEEIAEISTLPTVALPDRCLEKDALDYFGVKIGLSPTDGKTPHSHHYPYYKNGELSYKTRIIETKTMWTVGDFKGSDLFGWEQALSSGGRKLFITEGEPDAVALYQALRKKAAGGKWEHLVPAVVSLTSGADSAGPELASKASEISRSFKEVVLVFDNDEPGKRAEQAAMQAIPHATTVDLPGKDPNECVINGRSNALCNAVLFKDAAPKNTRLIDGSSLYTEAREHAAPGLSWPWEGMTKLTRGIRFGETVYIGAGVKMGKSEVVNSLAAHFMVEHNLPVFLAKPEEANKKTIKMVMSKVAGKIFHDPNIPFDDAAFDAACAKIGDDKLWMLSLYQHMGWESLRSDIITAVQDKGCKAVFIDPITNLINGVASGEANTVLQGIAQELAAMSMDLDFAAFIFCHLKAPDSGDPHERGGKVLSHQFSGSRAMMRSCNYMLGLEGNKDPELPDKQRNVRRLIVLEDREFGASGMVPLYWDAKTSLFNEMEVK